MPPRWRSCTSRRRAAWLIGRWPRVWLDDPKYLGEGDGLYQGLLEAGWTWLYPAVRWTALLWLGLMLLAWWRSYAPLRRTCCVLVAAWATLLDPGDRLSWFLD